MDINELLEEYEKKHDDGRLIADTRIQGLASYFGTAENMFRYLDMTGKSMTDLLDTINLSMPENADW